MITLTDKAAQHVSRYLTRRGKGVGLRVGVKTTGCSGLAYKLEYADEIAAEDEVFEYLPDYYKARREAVMYFPLLPHHGWHRQAGRERLYNRLDLYKEMLLDYGLHGRGAVQQIYANANTFITKPATLSKLVTDIDSLDWYSVDRDDLRDGGARRKHRVPGHAGHRCGKGELPGVHRGAEDGSALRYAQQMVPRPREMPFVRANQEHVDAALFHQPQRRRVIRHEARETPTRWVVALIRCRFV